MKSHTNARGKVVNGVLHAAMNWHVTTESTPEPSHSNVVIVIVASHVPIIWHYTWNVMFEWFQSIHHQIHQMNSINGATIITITSLANYYYGNLYCLLPSTRFLIFIEKHQPELKHKHKRKICNFIFHFSYTILNQFFFHLELSNYTRRWNQTALIRFKKKMIVCLNM